MRGPLHHVRAWAAADPHRLAHVSGDRRLTYGELVSQADALAAHLRRQLPADHSPIVVRGHKEPEMLVGFLGAAWSGHPYIPLDQSIPHARVERILTTAHPALTLDSHAIANLVSSLPVGSMEVRSSDLTSIEPTNPYYIIFTSGSTGEPKGVVIPYSALADFVEWMMAEHAFAPGEVFLNQAPFSFDLSVMDLYLALVSGGTLFSLDASTAAHPARRAAALASSGITTWVSTPSFAELCLSDPAFDASCLPAVRRFLFCGETLPPHVAAALLDRFPRAEVWNTYGPTEATVATTGIRITCDLLERYPSLPVGHPKPRTQIFLFESERSAPLDHDAAGAPRSGGPRGEIVIVGPNVSSGYLNDPELTERAFITYAGERGYRTGDAGYIQDGLLFFQGRLDRQVKRHGYRIELGDIEANLSALPDVRDAVVLAALEHGRARELTAFVIPAGGDAAFDLELRLRAALLERLPAYMLPDRFVFVASFPLTPNGKTDRRALARLAPKPSRPSETPNLSTSP